MIGPVRFDVESSEVDLTATNSTASLEPRVSNDEVRKAIWGPFYPMAQLTGLILPIAEAKVKTKTGLLHLIPNAVVSLILLANTIYSVIRINGIGMSISWSYSQCLFFMALHGFVSSLAMLGFKYNNYFDNVTNMLRLATKNNMMILKEQRKSKRFLKFLQLTLVVGSMALYCTDTYLSYHDLVVLPAQFKVPDNESQIFRKSMFVYQPLFCIDTVIKIYAAFVSSFCLILYTSANDALCFEFLHFNKTVKEAISNKSVLKSGILESFQDQIIQFMATARYLTEGAVGIISISFVAGIFVYFYSTFAERAFTDYLFFGRITFGFWIVVAVSFMLSAIVRSADFYNLLNETKDMLNLSSEIWVEPNEPRVHVVTQYIINNINNQDYGYKNIFPIKGGFMLFHTIMMFIPFLVDCLARAKYVPEFLEVVVREKQH